MGKNTNCFPHLPSCDMTAPMSRVVCRMILSCDVCWGLSLIKLRDYFLVSAGPALHEKPRAGSHCSIFYIGHVLLLMCVYVFSFYLGYWESSKLKVGWKINPNQSDWTIFWELQFANFLLDCLFMWAVPRRKLGTQGPVDLVGPDRS